MKISLTRAHHGVGDDIDSVADAKNFKVFKMSSLVFPLKRHLSKVFIMHLDQGELTVSDFCNSSSSSGRRQSVELGKSSHSGKDILEEIFNSLEKDGFRAIVPDSMTCFGPMSLLNLKSPHVPESPYSANPVG